MNRIPEFTADTSLFGSGRRYNAAGTTEGYSSSIVAQVKKDDDDDNLSTICLLLCLCCGIAGIRYCCAGCTVCAIATTLGDDGTILT